VYVLTKLSTSDLPYQYIHPTFILLLQCRSRLSHSTTSTASDVDAFLSVGEAVYNRCARELGPGLTNPPYRQLVSITIWSRNINCVEHTQADTRFPRPRRVNGGSTRRCLGRGRSCVRGLLAFLRTTTSGALDLSLALFRQRTDNHIPASQLIPILVVISQSLATDLLYNTKYAMMSFQDAF
jgi:hypothetical protein